MSALDINDLLIEEKPLHVPALSEIAEGKHTTTDLQLEKFEWNNSPNSYFVVLSN